MTNALTKAITDYLNLNGFIVWRQNTVGIFDRKKNVFRKNPALRTGIPDIIGYRKSDARFIGIEIKTGTDRLTEKQLAFLKSLKQAGGIALVVSSFDEFLQATQYPAFHNPLPPEAGIM